MNSGLGVATVLVAAVVVVLAVGAGGCRRFVRCLMTQMLSMRESMRATSDASTHPG